MSTNVGKVSFSFSKLTKKPALQPPPKETIKKIDKIEYIDSIENNSVQVINAEISEENKPLVIPLKNPNLLIQSVIDSVNSRKTEESKSEEKIVNDCKDNCGFSAKVAEGNCDDVPKKETLEEMAAREILQDATQQSKEEINQRNLTVPLTTVTDDKQESTLEDYENIPVSDFGLAMLRGMGWNPKKGIGKNGKIVKVDGPNVRPKGLGLGADKAFISQKPVGKNVAKDEVLGKSSRVRITFGKYKNLYGTVEGFDDDAGRINVFLAISGERVTLNECFVQLVTADEFSKYSKVLNINAYKNYKANETNEIKTEVESTNQNKNGRSSDRSLKEVKHSSSSKQKMSEKYSDSDSDSSKDEDYSNRNKHCDLKSKDRKPNSYTVKYSSRHESNSSKAKYYESNSSSTRESKYGGRSEVKSDKYSRRYSSDSDSFSNDDKYKSRTKSRDSYRESRRKSSSSSDREKKWRHKKNKKKKSRSRSRR